jgi:hypothetical protein
MSHIAARSLPVLALLGALVVLPVRAAEQIVRIKGGETAKVTTPGGAFVLRFVAVVSDERCPARVTCVWANPPVLALEASAPGQPALAFEVRSGGPGGARRGRYLGASIEYADLLPRPQEPGEFAKLKPLGAYTAALRITFPAAAP